MDEDWLDELPATPMPDRRHRQATADARQWRVRLRGDADVETRRLTRCLMMLADAPAADRDALLADRHCQPYAEILGWHAQRDLAARIEALALCRLPSMRIADLLQLDRPSVRRYCDAYYDVWERLDNSDYIIRYAVAPELHLGDRATSRRRTAMKFIAYLCGPTALEDLYGRFPCRKGTWQSPISLLRRQSVLLELDRLTEAVVGGGGADDGLRPEALEACFQSLEPLLRTAHPANQYEWLNCGQARQSTMFHPFALARGEAPSLDDPPRLLVAKKPSGRTFKTKRTRVLVDRGNAPARIRAEFRKLLRCRAPLPANAVAGPGTAPKWNEGCYVAPSDAMSWAEQQLAARAESDLAASLLFVRSADRRLQLNSGLANADSTVIVLSVAAAAAPSAFYATAWPTAAPVPVEGFATDWQTRRLAESFGGAVIAAGDAGEIVAWRRLGVAAMPTPQSPAAARSWGGLLWNSLAAMEIDEPSTARAIRSEIRTSAWQVRESPELLSRIIALDEQRRIRPTLIAAMWDPLTMAPRSDEEQQQAVAMLRDCWEYRTDLDAAVAVWTPPQARLQAIRVEVEAGSPATVEQVLRASLQHDLYYPCLPRMEASPSEDLVSARRRLAAIDAATSTEERERARRRYLKQYDNVVVEPLLREGATSSSPTDRMLTTVQAHLVGRFAEFSAAATLGLAGGDTSPRLQSASVTSLCQLTTEIRNLVRTQKELAHGSHR